MFIEQLDRPWLDTPLPFQSFYVRSPSEVAWIKDHCAFVLVDSGKSDSTLDFASYAVREAKPARADRYRELRSSSQPKPLHGQLARCRSSVPGSGQS
jgi:hypothetical protein